ncbi:MAG TPA: phosphate ABC transporter substrate-binding protein PstS [Thermomicrobiaceae bacterium]|nr:phosphate ABC transporter substrate-binding protein PstS [Thermomicrobiaceae bacterium]
MGTLGNPSKAVTLVETGSSLLYPLFNAWAPVIHGKYSNITVQTASTGSGTGIAQAVSGVAQFGATDAYMSDAQLKTAPGIINIPLAISAQQINYNLPGVTQPLKLSGPILAGIYDGTIRYWDDAQIKSANSGVSLPHQAIIPIHRTDGSGDTFLFSQYLSFSTPAWQSKVGYGTSVSWPAVPGALGAVGNPGMVQTCSQTKYSIAYIGISFLDEANSKGLGTAVLLNKAGSYVPIQQANIVAAASAMVPKTPKDERVSLIFAPGADSYPIINYEYVAVQTNQKDADTAQAMRTVLAWAIASDGGNASSFLNPVHFLPLPASVLPLSQAQIAQIK